MPIQETAEEVNGIDVGVVNELVNAVKEDAELGKCVFRARNEWVGATQNRTLVHSFYAAKEEMKHKQPFEMRADEPSMMAGRDEWPNPVEHLLSALASCVTTSIVSHAAARGINIKSLESNLEGDLDVRGFLGVDPSVPKGFSEIRINFKIQTDEEDLDKIKQLAEFSPVYNTVRKSTNVVISMERK